LITPGPFEPRKTLPQQHPLVKEDEAFVIVDELAHGVIEGDIEETVVKFTRYRLP